MLFMGRIGMAGSYLVELEAKVEALLMWLGFTASLMFNYTPLVM